MPLASPADAPDNVGVSNGGDTYEGERPSGPSGPSGPSSDVRWSSGVGVRGDGDGSALPVEACAVQGPTDSDLRASLTICELIVAQVLRREELGREAANALEHVVEELHTIVRALAARTS